MNRLPGKRRIPTRSAEYDAKEEQINAISRHMWPVCVVPPKHVLGWVVMAADKYASMQEYLGPMYRKIVKRRKHGDR